MRAAMPARSGRDRAALEALWWLARFPLVEEHHLEAFIGADRWTVTGMLRDLQERGIVASVMIDSPEFAEARRVYYLRAAGAGALAHALGLTDAELEQQLPAGRRELLARIARVETALAVAGFIADLSTALRDGHEASIVEARSSHWARPPKQISGLPAVEAHVRLRAGEASAGFALVWDRAAAPAAHRKRRIAAWYRADDEYHRTGRAVPPVLVVCPDQRTLGHWQSAIERSAMRRARDPLPLALATASDIYASGPLESRWQRPESGQPIGLLDCLAWHTASSVYAAPSPIGVVAPIRVNVERRQADTLQRWGTEQVRSGHMLPLFPQAERWAALALGLSATQKSLLDWVGHHPLLPATHLAVHLDLSARCVADLLQSLSRCGLVADESVGRRGSGRVPRYVLTALGAGFLAARDGVPPRLYLTEGVIAADGLPNAMRRARHSGTSAAASLRLSHLRRHLEHTAGAQGFALALAQEAGRQRACGRDHRLLTWLSDAEGQVWFRHDAHTCHIWPDARFRYRADGVVLDLLLEWDRGLVRTRDYLRKLAAYGAYFTTDAPARDGRQRLVIVTTAAAEARVEHAVSVIVEQFPRLRSAVHIIPVEAIREGGIIAVLQLGKQPASQPTLSSGKNHAQSSSE